MRFKNINELEKIFYETKKFIGLKEIDRHESGNFGNGYIEYSLKDLSLRLVVERGYPSIDIGRNVDNTEWFDLSLVVNFINNNDIMNENEITTLMEFLLKEHKKLINMFTNNYEESVGSLHRLEKELATRALDQVRTGNVQEYWKTGKI